MNTIDFIFIGAQKSGTTALHEYMKNHPSIILPKGKEAPFFNREEYYKLGINAFIKNTYPPTKTAGQLWGKISPQYMSNDVISERLLRALPNTQLLAILRDPIQRAKSHYVMTVQRGLETRDINTAFEQLLNPGNLALSRELASSQSNEDKCYIAWSEYGRIINYYHLSRPGNPPSVFYFEDMVNNPMSFMKVIFRTLGVDENYTSSIIGKQIFKGGENNIIKHVKGLGANPFIKGAWRCVPISIRSQLYFSVEQGLSRFTTTKKQNDKKSTTLHPDLINALKAHFRLDISTSPLLKVHEKWDI